MYLGDPGISLQENSKSLEYQISGLGENEVMTAMRNPSEFNHI